MDSGGHKEQVLDLRIAHRRRGNQCPQIGISALKDFFDSGITRNAVAIDDRRMRLRVQVYQQCWLPKLCQAIGQIHRDRGFADAPLLVQDGDFHSTRLSFASR
jgi:hypothetical protein